MAKKQKSRATYKHRGVYALVFNTEKIAKKKFPKLKKKAKATGELHQNVVLLSTDLLRPNLRKLHIARDAQLVDIIEHVVKPQPKKPFTYLIIFEEPGKATTWNNKVFENAALDNMQAKNTIFLRTGLDMVGVRVLLPPAGKRLWGSAEVVDITSFISASLYNILGNKIA